MNCFERGLLLVCRHCSLERQHIVLNFLGRHTPEFSGLSDQEIIYLNVSRKKSNTSYQSPGKKMFLAFLLVVVAPKKKFYVLHEVAALNMTLLQHVIPSGDPILAA
jgi:hypothetical protein